MSSEARKVLWFDPPPGDRPVEGNTIYVRSAEEASAEDENLRLREQAGEMAEEIERLRNPAPPRVWLAGDTVPEGVAVLVRDGYVIRPNSRPYRIASDGIEMPPMPPFGETVAKEKARRVVAEAAGEGAE